MGTGTSLCSSCHTKQSKRPLHSLASGRWLGTYRRGCRCRRKGAGEGPGVTDSGEVPRGEGAKPGVSSAGNAWGLGQACERGRQGPGPSHRRWLVTWDRADRVRREKPPASQPGRPEVRKRRQRVASALEKLGERVSAATEGLCRGGKRNFLLDMGRPEPVTRVRGNGFGSS